MEQKVWDFSYKSMWMSLCGLSQIPSQNKSVRDTVWKENSSFLFCQVSAISVIK